MASKVFLSCIITLILFNFIFFLAGLNTDILSVQRIIEMFLYVGAAALLASLIPTASTGGTATWFVNVLIAVGLFYSLTVTIPGVNWTFTVGIGLCSNLTNMFSSNLNSIAFLPFLFFTSIGLLGVISGIMSMSSGGD